MRISEDVQKRRVAIGSHAHETEQFRLGLISLAFVVIQAFEHIMTKSKAVENTLLVPPVIAAGKEETKEAETGPQSIKPDTCVRQVLTAH